ncbi:MAG: YajQ family cyclic di-GMP-binding protein [Polyangiales bacterium]
MPSFDVVSKVNWAEVDNALNQVSKELAQRYDFKDTGAKVEKTKEGLVITANSEGRVEAALDVLKDKLVKRHVSLKHVDPQTAQPAGGSTFRQLVKIKEGIDRDRAKKVIDAVKGSKIKVQAAIHDDTVRISGKNRDDLQETIKLLRGLELDIELQFQNFRE